MIDQLSWLVLLFLLFLFVITYTKVRGRKKHKRALTNMDHIKEFETMVFRLDPVFNIGSRDSQSWMFKFCNAIKKVNIESQSTTMFL